MTMNMLNVLLLSKNPMLVELIEGENYNLNWYNDDLHSCHNINLADVIIYDSFSYGVNPLKGKLLEDKPIVIIDCYQEDLFVSKLTDNIQRAYLFVDDFLEELDVAIDNVLRGGTYVTQKLFCATN